MNTQPEALRLANDLTALGGPLGNAAATLLRTQHADLERKDALLRQALSAMRFGLHVGFDETSESQSKKGDKAFSQHNLAIAAITSELSK